MWANRPTNPPGHVPPLRNKGLIFGLIKGNLVNTKPLIKGLISAGVRDRWGGWLIFGCPQFLGGWNLRCFFLVKNSTKRSQRIGDSKHSKLESWGVCYFTINSREKFYTQGIQGLIIVISTNLSTRYYPKNPNPSRFLTGLMVEKSHPKRS